MGGGGVARDVRAACGVGCGLWVVGASDRDRISVRVEQFVVLLLWLLLGTIWGRDLEATAKAVWISV